MNLNLQSMLVRMKEELLIYLIFLKIKILLLSQTLIKPVLNLNEVFKKNILKIRRLLSLIKIQKTIYYSFILVNIIIMIFI